MFRPDLIQLIFIMTLIALPGFAATLRSRSLRVWVFCFGGLAVVASALQLYATRIALDQYEIWLGAFAGDVFPIAVVATLTRLLPPSTRPWAIGFAALAIYIAAVFLGTEVGGRLGAIYR
jgi:hypothetical protein